MISFKGLKGEFKKITWPGRKEVVKKTGITLLVCAIMTAIIAVYDLFFNWIMRGLEDIFL
ncbi:MAG: preprotein translocase subunit SecE [Firmicutes bacterium]|nr:preprotein translocase subunit SecE [Bacillota bacterium]